MSTIFYTDDDQDDVFIFAQALKEIDRTYNLTTVEDGDELLQSLHNPPPTPNLIFLDLNMPGKDGRQTLKEIKESENLKELPVVIFSTSSNKEDIDFTYQHGASLYINKPTKYADLKKLLEKCLQMDWKNFERPGIDNYYLSAS